VSGHRFLVIAPEPVYEDRGTPIAVFHVLEALSEQGNEVDLLTYPIGDEINIPRVNVIRGPNPFRIDAVPIGFSLRKILLDLCLLPVLIRLLRRRSYCCIQAVEESVFLALLARPSKSTPVVYDMQSCMPRELARWALFRAVPVQALLRSLEGVVLRRVTLVVCSTGLRSYVKDRAPETKVMEWRYPAPPHRVSAEQARALRVEHGITPEKPIVLYCGNFEPYQGTALLIGAATLVREQHPDALFLLVGAPRASAEEMLARHRELVESGSLKIVSRQPRERISCYLSAAQILVSPRRSGANFPLKLFDYLSTGKPIVATREFHESLLPSDTAILVDTSAEGLAGGITRLLDDEELARRFGQQALEFAERELGWPDFYRQVSEIFTEAIRRCRDSAS
jgi:glycosyltransferase involved in cell wall biosynthesis